MLVQGLELHKFVCFEYGHMAYPCAPTSDEKGQKQTNLCSLRWPKNIMAQALRATGNFKVRFYNGLTML